MKEFSEVFRDSDETLAIIELEKALSSVNTWLAKARGVVRFAGVPGMPQNPEELDRTRLESIQEHMQSLLIYWDIFRAQCPNIVANLDKDKIATMLKVHDYGEVPSTNFTTRDITRGEQVKGAGKDKHEYERKAFAEHVSELPPIVRDKYVVAFNEFEVQGTEGLTEEATVAHIIDSIQGDFMYMDNAESDDDAKECTILIIKKFTAQYIKKAIVQLQEKSNELGLEELMNFVEAYCLYAQKRGYDISPETLLSEDD
jgi:5'-deoxynucleotidase YfbR-like HD superfamily hydrolase